MTLKEKSAGRNEDQRRRLAATPGTGGGLLTQISPTIRSQWNARCLDCTRGGPPPAPSVPTPPHPTSTPSLAIGLGHAFHIPQALTSHD
eukprot:1415150-Rhodomonas_salina.3